jgi:V8-like Glu-specific endopeptidase
VRIPGSRIWRGTIATVSTLAMAAAGAAATTGAAAAATGRPAPHPGQVHPVSAAAQRASQLFWTPARMAAATPVQSDATSAAPTPPPGIPSPTHFAGVPTVGTLFFTTGTQQHFCTASVVDSPTANLVLTAAHCVYGSSYATNIEYVPQYHDGQQPFGAWAVQTITVAAGWQNSHDPNLDFAFLTVTPPSGTHRPVQYVTGGLHLGINIGYAHRIEVIGYNNGEDEPIKCASRSFEFEPGQMEFYCNDFQDGTSGGPWIAGFNPHWGSGTVFGVIGGYEEGGDYPWASYSVYFSQPTLNLYWQAEAQQL